MILLQHCRLSALDPLKCFHEVCYNAEGMSLSFLVIYISFQSWGNIMNLFNFTDELLNLLFIVLPFYDKSADTLFKILLRCSLTPKEIPI